MNTNVDPTNNISKIGSDELPHQLPGKKASKHEKISLREEALKSTDKTIVAKQVTINPTDDMASKTDKQILSRTQEMLQQVRQKPTKRMKENQIKDLTPDPKFVCDGGTYEKLLPKFQEQLEKAKDFDTAVFLSGLKETPKSVFESNQAILDDSVNFMRKQAKDLAKEKSISLEDAYKLLIGVLDIYDDISSLEYQRNKFFSPLSTFALRSALLLATQEDGVGLQSWLIYTKSGKPETNIYDFMDDWKNWVPEAQGVMAKFSETTLIKAKDLMDNNTDKKVVLLKGGFGAGKTRLAGQLMGEQASGVLAPDLGKRVVRRAMPKIPHSLAHVQGSQVAYHIFNDLIRNQTGTVVYDSSLSLANDVQAYLTKSLEAGKKMVIYDVARHDMARSLAVLKRDVGGDDPRIPPDFIIRSAMNDKLNRAECMKVILNAKILQNDAEIAPEYRFVGADASGWNAEEVLILSPKNVTQLHLEMNERLALEGIEIKEMQNPESVQLQAKIKKIEQNLANLKIKKDHTANTRAGRAKKVHYNTVIHELEIDLRHLKRRYAKLPKIVYDVRSIMDREQLTSYFGEQFERPVQEIMQELSAEENKSFLKVFGERELLSNFPIPSPISNEEELYAALPQKIKNTLPEIAFKQAFAAIKEETRNQFFQSIQKPIQEKNDLSVKIKKAENHLAYLKNKRDHASGKSGRAKKGNLNTLISAQEANLKTLQSQYQIGRAHV